MGRVSALRAPLVAVLAAVALLALPISGSVHIDARAAVALNGLKVTGNRITDASGKPVMLRGVNRSGTEYACQQGWGIFDGPSDSPSVVAMTTWHINYVRVLLNEDCWLGINVPTTYRGAVYRTAIENYVTLLNSNGIYVELSLIFGAPGGNQASFQPDAPDASHSPAFWTSAATAFKSNPNVFFGIWGEPANISWSCWENGCSNEATWNGTLYATAGSQSLVDAIRATGATQIISVPGIDYANDLSQWPTYEPSDVSGQLIAEMHVYGKNGCWDSPCLNSTVAPLVPSVPVIFGETGETYDSTECGSGNEQVILPWADAHNVGYAAWVWDAWSGDCLSLVTPAYDGTPNTTDPPGTTYAQYIHDHLLEVTGGRTSVTGAPPPTPLARGVNPISASPSPGQRNIVARQAAILVLGTRASDPDVRMSPGFYRALNAA